MGKIILLSPWLQRIFLPAESPGLQPFEVSSDISYVHSVFQGTEFDPLPIVSGSLGGAGVNRITLVGPQVDQYIFIHAAHVTHNDTSARAIYFSIDHPDGEIHLNLGRPAAVGGLLPAGLGRTVIIPPLSSLTVFVENLGAGKVITGIVMFSRIDIGRPHPVR